MIYVSGDGSREVIEGSMTATVLEAIFQRDAANGHNSRFSQVRPRDYVLNTQDGSFITYRHQVNEEISHAETQNLLRMYHGFGGQRNLEGGERTNPRKGITVQENNAFISCQFRALVQLGVFDTVREARKKLWGQLRKTPMKYGRNWHGDSHARINQPQQHLQ